MEALLPTLLRFVCLFASLSSRVILNILKLMLFTHEYHLFGVNQLWFSIYTAHNQRIRT